MDELNYPINSKLLLRKKVKEKPADRARWTY